jgi:uncharacterized caspase-like protein
MGDLALDPARTRALLIGADSFPEDPEHLPGLPAVANNLSAFADVLADPEVLGVPRERIATLANPSVVEMQKAVARTAQDAEDGLVVYYAGHGLVAKGRLHLTARDSVEADIEFSGVDIEKVREAVRGSPARKRIVILDCCYSGRAVGAMSGGTRGLVASALDDFAGSYVLTAAAATQTALAPPGARLTLFTENLIGVLREGVEGAGPGLRLPVVFQALRKRLMAAPGAPEPQQSSTQTLDMAAVFRNRSPKAVVENADNMAAMWARLEALERRNVDLQEQLSRKSEGREADGKAVDEARRLLEEERRKLEAQRARLERNDLAETDLDEAEKQAQSLGDVVGDLKGWWRAYQKREDERIRRHPWLYVWLTPVLANVLPFIFLSELEGTGDGGAYVAVGPLLAAAIWWTFRYGGRRLGWSAGRIWRMTAIGNAMNALVWLAALGGGFDAPADPNGGWIRQTRRLVIDRACRLRPEDPPSAQT